MAQHREVKDSLIFNEDILKNKDEQSKKKTEIKEKESNKEKNDHSFYEDKNNSDKGWFRRHLKAIIIIFIIFIILLALGLGLGLGLSNKKSLDRICIGGKCYTKEAIQEYIDKQSNPAQYETKYLKDNSVIWAYQILIDDDLGSQKNLDDAENKADNQISDEKDTYRDQYGDDWKDKWDENLLSKGFDTEGQYRSNLIANSLLSSISNIITSDTYLYFDDNTDPNTKKYRSTLETESSKRYYALNGDYNQQEILYDDPILNQTVLNHQFLFDFYQKIYQPISYEDILIPFTFESPIKNGLVSETQSFALTADNIDDVWIFLSDLAVISYQAVNGSGIDDWEFLDFKNPDYVSTPTFTDSGVTDLSSSIGNSSTVSLVLMEIYGNLISQNYTNPDFDTSIYNSQSGMFDYYYSFHEELALEYRDVFKDIYSAYGETLPITALNKDKFFIPAYGSETTDGITWTDDSLPITDFDKYNSIDDTFNGENTDTYISNLTGTTAGSQVVAQVNKGFYAKVDSTTNLISETDRQIFYHLQIPTINHYSYDGTTFTFNNVKADIIDNDLIDNDLIIEEDYYLTQSIDGIHLVHNNVLNENDPAEISDAQVMLAYQLDQKLLENNPNSIYQLYQYDYDILSSYQSWLSSEANDIIFNQYLNYINDTYNFDGGEFSDEEVNEFKNGEDLDWDLKSDPNSILNQFYNQILWDDISKTTSQVARSNNFFDTYGSIYLDGFDINNWDASLHQLLSYFSFDGDKYELKTIDQLYNSGNLSN